VEYGGKEVNHSGVGPFRVVGNALQKTASSYVYKAMWVTYTLSCSLGSVSMAYRSSAKRSTGWEEGWW